MNMQGLCVWPSGEKFCAAWSLVPVQEVVFVEVSDTGGDLAGHPLQLQQLSGPEPPVLLRQVSAQIPLQTHTPPVSEEGGGAFEQTHLHSLPV